VYRFFKIIAGICLFLHTYLLFAAVTDWFNRIIIGVALLVLIMPKKYWPLYILPSIITLAGCVVGGYLLILQLLY
jgi:hypothetical protein